MTFTSSGTDTSDLLRRGLLALACVALTAACGGDDDKKAGPNSGDGGAGAEVGGTAGRGGSGTGGTGIPRVEFEDLPGRLRFANFTSNGTEGVALDVYFGSSAQRGELAMTVGYETISDFIVPRRPLDGLIDENETQLTIYEKGKTGNADILLQLRETLKEESVITVAIAGTEGNALTNRLPIQTQFFYEHALSTPPAGFAHVYQWDHPWDLVEGVSFGVIGAEGLCDPERGEVTGGNLGVPALIPDGATGVSLFDANTECATGSAPVAEAVEGGHSYVVLGEATTTDPADRVSVLLELGVSE